MSSSLSRYITWLVLPLLVILGVLAHCCSGLYGISLDQLLSGDITEQQILILRAFRFPKIIVAILGGSAISIAGLLMQSYFRNPLAGPFVLGISSGASLGVAIFLMGSSLIPWLVHLGKLGLVGSAMLGSAFVLSIVMASAKKISSSSKLLVIGLMWASLTSSIVGVLEFFAGANEVKFFLIWSMGSLLNVSNADIMVLAPSVLLGLAVAVIISKKLDVLLLGKDYALTLGINYKLLSKTVLLITCLLAGVTTAYIGPLAFVGLAIPHFCRNLLKTNLHRQLIINVILMGAAFLLWCQWLSEYLFSGVTLPINIITSIIGAPVVIRILLKRSN